MVGSQVYTLRKMGRTLICGSYGSQHGSNVRSLVADHVTEFKNVNFRTY